VDRTAGSGLSAGVADRRLVDDPAAPLPGPGWRRRVAAWLPLVAVLVVLVGMLLQLGTSARDIAAYTGYAMWGVVLPGTLVYRALRRTPASLVEDLSFGAATGLVLEIVAFCLFAPLHLGALLVAWPVLVVVPFVAVPALRVHWRPSGYLWRVTAGWSWAVAGAALALLTYLRYAFVAVNPVVPTRGPHLYFFDQVMLLSLVGDAKHHFPPASPSVLHESLPYHWFAFAHMAVASTVTGVDTPVVFFRFFPTTISLLAVLLLAVIGWRISGRPWVGAVATVLHFVVGELTVTEAGTGYLGSVTAYVVWSSNSVPYGWVIMFPLVAILADRLRGTSAPAPLGRGGWVLLALFALASPGAKSTILPVTIAGVGLAVLVTILQRRFDRTVWAVAGILVAAQVFGTVVLYRFESQGVHFRPFGIFSQVTDALPPVRPWWKDVALLGFLLLGYLIFMGTRLVGIGVLARVARDRWGLAEWFLLGGIGGGVAATLLLWHPTLSQNYFVRSAFVFGALLSAMGAVALVERYALRPWTVVVIAVGAGAVAGAVSYRLRGSPYAAGGPSWRLLKPIYAMAGGIVAAMVAFVLLVWLVRLALSRWRGPGAGGALRGVAPVAVLCLALAGGLPSLFWDARLYPNAGTFYHVSVTPDGASAARWLRANSDPDDVVATNVHCSGPPPAVCGSLASWLPAFSERRYLVETWAYTATANRLAGEQDTSSLAIPFWDPALLAENDAAFTAPTADGLADLRRRGVRWLVGDRAFGAVSATLDTLATRRWERGDLVIYQL
jgi:hypothetical protein